MNTLPGFFDMLSARRRTLRRLPVIPTWPVPGARSAPASASRSRLWLRLTSKLRFVRLRCAAGN